MLHDCVNQLAVLGGVSPLATKDGGESTKLLVGDSIGAAVDKQRELETEYDRLLREREDLLKRGGTPPPGPRAGEPASPVALDPKRKDGGARTLSPLPAPLSPSPDPPAADVWVLVTDDVVNSTRSSGWRLSVIPVRERYCRPNCEVG